MGTIALKYSSIALSLVFSSCGSSDNGTASVKNCGPDKSACPNGQQCWGGECQTVGANATLQSIDTPPLEGGDAPSLNRGSAITSENGVYELIMQADGNLVLYRTTIPNNFTNCPSSNCKAIFSSYTSNVGAAPRAYMQTDGNFVVYDVDVPRFSTKTSGNPGDTLLLQNDGNLVIYSSTGALLWSSGTASPDSK